MLVINLCLTDLPKDKISVSEKNGKKYISLVVNERKDADQYGNTHSVAVNQTKDERENKKKKEYVGSGKEYNFDNNNQNNSYTPPQPTNQVGDTDDLPF